MMVRLPLIPTAGAAVAACAAIASYATFVPGNSIWGDVFWHGDRNGAPRVALTFDDGPTDGPTQQVLAILAQLGVRATFFVIGKNVEHVPDLLRRIDAEGHLIGNHTYSHSKWCAAGHRKYWRWEIEQTDAAIERAIGRRPRFFRPPIGHKTPYTLAAARAAGHVVATWDVRAWDGIPTSKERILAHVSPRCRRGTIVVMHDGSAPGRRRDPTPTIDSIAPLVQSLRERGLEPVGLEELAGMPGYI